VVPGLRSARALPAFDSDVPQHCYAWTSDDAVYGGDENVQSRGADVILRSSQDCECLPVLKNPVADDLIYSLALTTPLAFFLDDDHAARRGPHLDPSFGVSVVGHCQSHRRHYVVVYVDYYLVCYLGITSPCGGRPLVVLASRGRRRNRGVSTDATDSPHFRFERS
jgi:hypothetical protein